MADNTIDPGVPPTSFFDRCSLSPEVVNDCHAFVQSRFSDPMRPVVFQGYCSYTVQVGDDTIVQFRDTKHGPDLKIISAARTIFLNLVPKTIYLGQLGNTCLHVFSMNKLPGISLSDLRAQVPVRDCMREQLVRDFARLQATSWRHSKAEDQVSKRLVGSSLDWRLQLLFDGLPSRMQPVLTIVKSSMTQIKSLPWTISHGDLIPANIMTCPATGQMVGLLDWAEAEFLPFGVGMYGLEELLGEVRSTGEFSYYSNSLYLRRVFWTEIKSNIPELARDPALVATVQRAQILGILLWRGIAFDNGRLNRVVREGTDDEDMQRLKTFLFAPESPGDQILPRPPPVIAWMFRPDKHYNKSAFTRARALKKRRMTI